MEHMPEELRLPFLPQDLILFQRPSRLQSRDNTGQSTRPDPNKLQPCRMCLMDARFVCATTFSLLGIGFFLLLSPCIRLMDWTCHFPLSVCDSVSNLVGSMADWQHRYLPRTWPVMLVVLITYLILIGRYVLCSPMPSHSGGIGIHRCPVSHQVADIWMGMVSFVMFYRMRRGSSAVLEQYDDRNNVTYAPVSKRMGWLNKGWLVLRLAPYPDLFTSPWLRWLNPIHSTFMDWQRRRTAAMAYCELWHDGKLRADIHHICQFEYRRAALAEDTEYTFLEVDLWDWATWA